MSIYFPNEIWLNIIDILGLQGYTRDCTNLINALQFQESLVYKYLVTALYKERYMYGCTKNAYDQQMIDFWKKTGIDDGVPKNYIVDNLNSSTKMYKTIWAYSVFTNNKGKYKLFNYILFDFLQGSNNYRENYTNCVFIDDRQRPQGIMYLQDFSKKSLKKINNYLEDLDKIKKINLDGCLVLDRINKIVLCKSKGSLI